DAPPEHDVFGNGERALHEHGAQFEFQPVVEFRPTTGVGDLFDTKTDLGKRDIAYVQQIKFLRCNEFEHPRFRAWAAQFRDDVGVEQPTVHNTTSRTGNGPRAGSISMSRYGDACSASIKAWPVVSPFRRRNSSADTMKASSRPCTVTSCGPSVFARRTTSEKRALASCSSQRPF